jgi:hypothetical protein
MTDTTNVSREPAPSPQAGKGADPPPAGAPAAPCRVLPDLLGPLTEAELLEAIVDATG